MLPSAPASNPFLGLSQPAAIEHNAGRKIQHEHVDFADSLSKHRAQATDTQSSQRSTGTESQKDSPRQDESAVLDSEGSEAQASTIDGYVEDDSKDLPNDRGPDLRDTPDADQSDQSPDIEASGTDEDDLGTHYGVLTSADSDARIRDAVGTISDATPNIQRVDAVHGHAQKHAESTGGFPVTGNQTVQRNQSIKPQSLTATNLQEINAEPVQITQALQSDNKATLVTPQHDAAPSQRDTLVGQAVGERSTDVPQIGRLSIRDPSATAQSTIDQSKGQIDSILKVESPPNQTLQANNQSESQGDQAARAQSGTASSTSDDAVQQSNAVLTTSRVDAKQAVANGAVIHTSPDSASLDASTANSHSDRESSDRESRSTQTPFRSIERPAVIDYAAAERAAQRLQSSPQSNSAKTRTQIEPLERTSGSVQAASSAGVSQDQQLSQEISTDAMSKLKPAPTGKATNENVNGAKAQQAFDAQAMRAMNAAVRQSGGTLNIRLTPDTLGTLRITLDIRAGVAAVNIQVGSNAAAELLSASMPSLRAALESNGLSVDRLSTQINQGLASSAKADTGSGSQHRHSESNQSQQWGGDGPGANAGKQGNSEQRSQTYEQARAHAERSTQREASPRGTSFEDALRATAQST